MPAEHGPRARLRLLGISLASLAALYMVGLASLYWAMRQPPERFGAIMKAMPGPAMMLIPFKPLWTSARAGQLAPGDSAPDFDLPTTDHRARVRLAQQWRERPVALIFGSYT